MNINSSQLKLTDQQFSSTFSISDSKQGPSKSPATGRPWCNTILLIVAIGLGLVCILMLSGYVPSVLASTYSNVGEVKTSIKEIIGRQKNYTKGGTQESTITQSRFGKLSDGTVIYSYSLKNQHGMEARFLTLGGTLTHLFVPDSRGNFVDVVLGFDSIQDYEHNIHYLGPIIGRYALRIKSGQFTLEGVDYQLFVNNHNNTLHGGHVGWDQAVWNARTEKDVLYLSHISPDGDENFPGEVHAQVSFQVTNDNQLQINMSAIVKRKATPINLTYHPYFNLAGQGTIENHKVQIFAEYYLPALPDVMPTGDIAPVNGTVYDLLDPIQLGQIFPQVTVDDIKNGYDHMFCVRGPPGMKHMARVIEPTKGLVMEVFSNQPGLQFYTGNYLNTSRSKRSGGQGYGQWDGFCMEPQGYPDAINIPQFPDCVLRPGSVYINNMAFKFSLN